MKVEEHVVVSLAMGEHEPTTIIGAKEARTTGVVTDMEVVGVSITRDTIKGYDACAAWPWNKRIRPSCGVWEEEPWELMSRQGPLYSEPPIMACH
jgi:hypothetical protein